MIYRAAKSQTGDPDGESIDIKVPMAYAEYFVGKVGGEVETSQIRIGQLFSFIDLMGEPQRV